jgi:hypothetical protein
MRNRRLARLFLLPVAFLVVRDVRPQQPFDLDTTFRAPIDTWYVSSIAPLPDGRVFLSGMVRFPGDPIGSFRGGAMLLPNGQRDMSFPNFPLTIGAGKVTPWNGQYYVATTQTVRRLDVNCLIDPTFIQMNSGPYFSSLQGGDYHVYPDGRILMSGMHVLSDSIRGYEGLYCLIWFSNTGYLDTTAHHRTCAGSLDVFTELPDGNFIGSGSTSTWDGQPASNIVRFHADGELDPTFQADVWWGQAFAFLPLPDGRVYAGGHFRITGISDTLQLVRFLPDGSLDPSFNNNLYFAPGDLDGSDPGPTCIHPLDDGRLIVTGGFQWVDGQQRGGICVVDTNGNLLNDYFTGAGGGSYVYMGLSTGTVRGIMPAATGDGWYTWGSYHGYDDGTTNDTLQRMVSRLYGLNVGVHETQEPQTQVTVHPNPGGDRIWFDGIDDWGPVHVSVFDARGLLVMAGQVQPNAAVDVSTLGPGFFAILLSVPDGRMRHLRWVKE